MEPKLDAQTALLCRLIGETELLKNCVVHLMASMRDPAGARRSIDEAARNGSVTINDLLAGHTAPRLAALAQLDSLAATFREALGG